MIYDISKILRDIIFINHYFQHIIIFGISLFSTKYFRIYAYHKHIRILLHINISNALLFIACYLVHPVGC